MDVLRQQGRCQPSSPILGIMGAGRAMRSMTITRVHRWKSQSEVADGAQGWSLSGHVRACGLRQESFAFCGFEMCMWMCLRVMAGKMLVERSAVDASLCTGWDCGVEGICFV